MDETAGGLACKIRRVEVGPGDFAVENPPRHWYKLIEGE